MSILRAFLAGGLLVAAVGPASAANNAVADIYSAPFQGETPVTVGSTPSYVGRAFKANCTSGGAITWTYADGSTGSWTVLVGSQTLPIALAQLTATTATCAYANLK